MANLIDLSKLNIGDQFRLGNDKYELAGMDAPWVSNEAMKMTSVTLHLKSLGYAGITSAEDVRGPKDLQDALANDHTAPEGATSPLAGQEANLDRVGASKVVFDTDLAKKDASQNGTATDEPKK